ncbi:aminotransferase class V-fold PLP-dependent enzyme [Roseicyclus sp. F158]|uniref:Aminotransferase class V-fold PLP-dependent enzyme n=1 Tax=Tropicimonas omnivorans TaxID=3075590 RepID=A0ABU3DKV2_9RHOB|nr:aminotransferase class V-fold PLP-dependent enzyme [Roseicyclus sp. F158]MDT0684349.1 aminotransferase class V-fold PLP-dependent enzyme [Roseicyclus sp. F158]
MTTDSAAPFDVFEAEIAGLGREGVRSGVIGDGTSFETPFGTKSMIYADHVASGRALMPVERFVMEKVLPIYSNSHTEASHCGRQITRMRKAARDVVARETGAGDGDHVVFCGNGATAGLNRLVLLLRCAERVASGERVVVLIGPYEHHSNILPWRESGAEVIEIVEAPGGGPDLGALTEELDAARDADLVVGAFSAASNVTGRLSPVAEVTRLLKSFGALAIWDYACGAPYLPMSMTPEEDAPIDAIVFSPHKFLGGPGGSGVLVLRQDLDHGQRPTAPGGGTVSFVSPWSHTYLPSLAAREEAGTPDVIGDIRTALALLVKRAIGQDRIARQDEALRQKALAAWAGLPGLHLMGQEASVPALPIFSFQIFDGEAQVHPQLVTRMLSDHFGVQARGGCACAGPYAHRLLRIDQAASEVLEGRLSRGEELAKPGWTRLSLHWAHREEEVDAILAAVRNVVLNARELAGGYSADPATARFTPSKAA